jgi:hypothetical protein
MKIFSSSHAKVNARDPPFRETMTTFKFWSCQSDAPQTKNWRFEDGDIVNVHNLFLSDNSFNIFNSFPFLHLLRERALRAVGIIPHAKVLVDLKQTLLVRDGFQELFPEWIVSKETRRSRFESAVR